MTVKNIKKYFENLFQNIFKDKKPVILKELSQYKDGIIIVVSFKLNVGDAVDIVEPLYEEIIKTLKKYAPKLDAKKELQGEDFVMLLLSNLSFQSEDGYGASAILLSKGRISSLDDNSKIMEFCINTRTDLIRRIDEYRIIEINRINIKIF